METWRNKLKNWKCFSTSIEGFTDAVKPAEDSVVGYNVISIVICLSVCLFASVSVYKYKSVTYMIDKRYLNLDPDVTCQ